MDTVSNFALVMWAVLIWGALFALGTFYLFQERTVMVSSAAVSISPRMPGAEDEMEK